MLVLKIRKYLSGASRPRYSCSPFRRTSSPLSAARRQIPNPERLTSKMADLLEKFTSAFEAYNPIFQDLSRPVAGIFGLENLGPHFDVFVCSFVFFNLANIVLVPGFSMLLFNRTYGVLDAKTRNKWCVTFRPFFRDHRRGRTARRGYIFHI